ncbi:MAG TPA: pyridoxine 5'-phosphate synthase [Thermoanaerobaculia bacterium]|nr:pyridoxine 5'-phosphate synthase [Thermoanaerobaculia bacterium]
MGTRLSVNVDHIATLRQARRSSYPDPVEAARLAEAAGASGITAHLRVDRRHIQDSDVERLRGTVRGKLNLEMSTSEEMLRVALRVRPDQVTLVPERPEEVTTEGGLNLLLYGRRVGEVAERLAGEGIEVSLFLDPNARQIQALAELASRGVGGFEINTDAYTRVTEPVAIETELRQIADAVEQGRAAGFHAYAGHGLRTDNVGPIAAIPGMEELNIGHFIVARAALVGMEAAVREMLAAIGGA